MKSDNITDQIEVFIQERVIHYFQNSQLQTRVILHPDCLVIRLYSFLDAETEELIYRGDLDVFRSIRELMMEYVLKDIQEHLLHQFNIELQAVYYDWDENDQSSMIVAMLQENKSHEVSTKYRKQSAVHEQLMEVTYDVEKYPDLVFSFWIDHHTLIMVREGLLVRIEKELVKQGFQEVLRKTKRIVEKTAFLQSNIEQIIGRSVKAIYLDWEFNQDKSVLVYSFID